MKELEQKEKSFVSDEVYLRNVLNSIEKEIERVRAHSNRLIGERKIIKRILTKLKK